jgi:hypothetical protein
MKNLFAALLIVLTSVACTNKKQIASDSKTKSDNSVTAKLYFHHISMYCGGAAPNEALLAEYAKGRAWTNKKLYISQVGKDDYKAFETDSTGNVKLDLTPGNYCIKVPYKVEKDGVEKLKAGKWQFDEKCLASEVERCNFSFIINNDSTLKFTYRSRCFYMGPNNCVLNPGPAPP